MVAIRALYGFCIGAWTVLFLILLCLLLYCLLYFANILFEKMTGQSLSDVVLQITSFVFQWRR